jgi:hypothetical protein
MMILGAQGVHRNLGIPGNSIISSSPSTLYTLNVALGNAPACSIGVDLDNA